MKAKRELLASQISLKRRQNNEDQLARELGRFFKKLKKSVLKGLNEYWSEYQLLQGQVNLMLSPVHEAHKEYYEIIRKYKLREYQLGKAEAKRLTRLANKDKVALKAVTTMGIQGFVDKDKNSLFGTIPKAEEDLLNRTFRTSQNTLNRVDNQLNQIISDGYREGKGINKVANDITQRFDQLETWEARRIARTEINTSHNQATRDQYREDGVEYTQWIAAGDDRTRDSHVDVDGEIIPIDGKYSNGLEYPGDTSGPLEEWINCRCSNAPFVIPYGFIAPSFSPFRESDLVPINQEVAREPTPEQLEQNLTQAQRTQYDKYTKAVEEAQSIIDSKFSLPRERLQARTQLEYSLSKLNQLKMVANGELARGYQQVVGTIIPNNQQTQEETENSSALEELNRFRLTPEEMSRMNELESMDKMGFLLKHELKKLKNKQKMHELHLKLNKEGKLSLEEAKDYVSGWNYHYGDTAPNLSKGDYQRLQGIEVKPKPEPVKEPTPREPEVEERTHEPAPKTEVVEGTTYTNYTEDPYELLSKQVQLQKQVKYTKSQKEAVHEYGFEAHLDVASILFQEPSIKTGLRTDAQIRGLIDEIARTIEDSPRLTEDVTIFRGGEVPNAHELKVGDVFEVEGFQSYSLNQDVAIDFLDEYPDRYLIKTHAPKGSKGVHIDDDIFQGLAEDEWLLQKGQKHKVIDINTETQELTTILVNDW